MLNRHSQSSGHAGLSAADWAFFYAALRSILFMFGAVLLWRDSLRLFEHLRKVGKIAVSQF